MPMKCIAHTPMPIVTAPAASHERLASGLSAALIRSASPRTAYAARDAMITDRATSHGSYVPASASRGSTLLSRKPQWFMAPR